MTTKTKRSFPATGVGAKVLFQSYLDPNNPNAFDATGVITNLNPSGGIFLKCKLRRGFYKDIKNIHRAKGEWKYKTKL